MKNKNYNFYVYIMTNIKKSILYTGLTNDLTRRVYEHTQDAKNAKNSFAGKYNCTYLFYWERHQYIDTAIKREKEIKGWTRAKKVELIKSINMEMIF